MSLTPDARPLAVPLCVNIRSGGQRASVTGDMMHHALQCREPDWYTIFDWDREGGGAFASAVPEQVADTGTLVLPIHFRRRPSAA